MTVIFKNLPRRRALGTTTLLSMLLLAVLPGVVIGQDFDRLFTSPVQREEMDMRRQKLLAPEEVEAEVTSQAEAAAESESAVEEILDTVYRFQGIVRRSDSPNTVWLNGAALAESNLPEHIELLLAQDLLRIRQPLTGRSYLIRPGQMLNLSSGQISEFVVDDPTAAGPESAGAGEQPTAESEDGASAERLDAADARLQGGRETSSEPPDNR